MSLAWWHDRPHPIVSASMAGASDGALAAAVTRAGGLGTIGVGGASTPGWVGAQAEIARAAGPFGIGLTIWMEEGRSGVVEAACAAEPDLLVISFGDPTALAGRVRELAPGSSLAIQVGTRAEAEQALALGPDLVIARGSEGGGHGRSEVATLPLLQEVLELAGDVPVLAAGGIATGRGLAAVLAAGAAGAWVGTPFAACAESTFAPALKAAVIAAGTDGTAWTRVFDLAQQLGWPPELGGRALRNDFLATWQGREDELVAALADDPGMTPEMERARAAGDPTLAPVYAGQSAGLVPGERTAAEVVAELATCREHLAAASRRWTSA